MGRGAAAAGVQLAPLEDPIALVQFRWGDRFRDTESERQPCVERLEDSDGHLWGGVPVAGADAAATLELPAAAALVTHKLIDHPGRDAGVLEPGRKAVPKIVRPAKLQMRKVALGSVGCVLVEVTKAVTREDRSGAKGHAVPAAGTGKDERVGVRIGRQLATNRLDHQRSQWDLAGCRRRSWGGA